VAYCADRVHPSAPGLRLILVAGASNAGKTTLAADFAARLAWPCLATDGLARHPGRPWGTVPPHVERYYRDHDVGELLADVERHYRGLAGRIEALVMEQLGDSAVPGLVVEGSALLPETVGRLQSRCPAGQVLALWLSPAPGVLRKRMHVAAAYAHADARRRVLVDRFLDRAQAFEHRQAPLAAAAGMTVVEVPLEPSESPDSGRLLGSRGVLGGI
jgi:hypothetical protein